MPGLRVGRFRQSDSLASEFLREGSSFRHVAPPRPAPALMEVSARSGANLRGAQELQGEASGMPREKGATTYRDMSYAIRRRCRKERFTGHR